MFLFPSAAPRADWLSPCLLEVVIAQAFCRLACERLVEPRHRAGRSPCLTGVISLIAVVPFLILLSHIPSVSFILASFHLPPGRTLLSLFCSSLFSFILSVTSWNLLLLPPPHLFFSLSLPGPFPFLLSYLPGQPCPSSYLSSLPFISSPSVS